MQSDDIIKLGKALKISEVIDGGKFHGLYKQLKKRDRERIRKSLCSYVVILEDYFSSYYGDMENRIKKYEGEKEKRQIKYRENSKKKMEKKNEEEKKKDEKEDKKEEEKPKEEERILFNEEEKKEKEEAKKKEAGAILFDENEEEEKIDENGEKKDPKEPHSKYDKISINNIVENPGEGDHPYNPFALDNNPFSLFVFKKFQNK